VRKSEKSQLNSSVVLNYLVLSGKMVRILVVDGFGSSSDARDRWKEFCKIVVAACDLQNIHVNMQTCKYNRLHEYIYQPDSAFVDPLSIKRFDRLDLIFVGGEATILPWSPRFQQVLILCRMCFQTNKCLFATSFACHMLTYLCATGGEPDVRVINGNGKGTPRDELPNFVVPHDIKKRDLFFDNVQGDFFQYESWESRAGKVTSGAGSGGEWIPYCHSGLRQRSKFMTSLPRKYKPKEPAGKNATQTLAPSTIFETVLTIRNRYIQHWAFKGVSNKKFKVGRYNALDIDEKTSGSAKKSYQVCADSGDGLVPQVIECGNCFGTQFEPRFKYPDTVKIVENFVCEKYKQMNRHAYLDVSSRFMLMTATSAIDGEPVKDHREHNPSPLLRKIRRQQKELEENRIRLEKEQRRKRAEQAKERAKALGYDSVESKRDGEGKTNDHRRMKEKKRRPASAGPARHSSSNTNKKKHIVDPRLMKPPAPVDRGRRSRPATALPYRAKVLPRPFIGSGRTGSISNSIEDPGYGEKKEVKKSVVFAPSVEGGLTSKSRDNRDSGNDDTLLRAAKVGVKISNNNYRNNNNRNNKNTNVRPDGFKSVPGKRTQNNKIDIRWDHRHIVATRVVHEVLEEPKPFSAWKNKYKELTRGEKAFSGRVVTGVAASGPYISQYKHERLEYMRSKQKWIDPNKQFRRHFGKASQVIGKNIKAGIAGSGDYRDPTNEFRDPDDRSKFMNPIRGWRRY
jgi:hypothetical protein